MSKTKASPPALSVASAAALLAERLGGKQEHWVSWLKNDRRPGRANHIPIEAGPGRPRYAPAHVERFIREQQATRPAIQERLEEASDEVRVPALLRLAVMLDDAGLREELDAAMVDGSPVDMVAFEVLAGDDQHGQPTIWVRSGLRGGMHYAITLPLTREEVIERTAKW